MKQVAAKVQCKLDHDDLANSDAPVETDKSKLEKAASGFARLFGSKKTAVKDEDGKTNAQSVEWETSKWSTRTTPGSRRYYHENKRSLSTYMKSSIANNLSASIC